LGRPTEATASSKQQQQQMGNVTKHKFSEQKRTFAEIKSSFVPFRIHFVSFVACRRRRAFTCSLKCHNSQILLELCGKATTETRSARKKYETFSFNELSSAPLFRRFHFTTKLFLALFAFASMQLTE